MTQIAAQSKTLWSTQDVLNLSKTFGKTTAGTFTIPEYTVLNASLFYNAEKFGVNVKLNNIENKEIYDGWSTIHPKDPRAIVASFTYKF